MVSTATSRLRLNKQGTGDSPNTWGVVLNGQVFDLLDEAVGGVETIALTGNKTLTSTNYVSDEARNMALRFTGSLTSGATITIPAVEKLYFIINDSGQTLTFSAGAGNVGVETGRRKWIACDGTDVYMAEDGADFEYVEATFLKLAGGTMTGALFVPTPTSDLHASTKKYVDDSLMGITATSELPGQASNAGKFLTTDGTVAGWYDLDAELALTYQPLDADLTAIAALTTTAAGREQLTLTRRTVTNADSPVTAAYGEDITCDSSGGPITINLPAAVANRAGITIRAGADALTDNITVEPDGAETILGQSNLVIDINYFAYTFVAKTGAWG